MLPDSAHIQEEDIKWKNRKRQRADLPQLDMLYTPEDAIASLSQFRTVTYGEKAEAAPTVSFRFQDAGHILGSGSLEVWVTEKNLPISLVFSGDIGHGGQAIVKDLTPIKKADYVIMETTYAAHCHKSREETLAEFKSILQDCIAGNGNIVIPSFAVERTQEIIYELHCMHKAGELPDIPIFIDSPLAINATEIFRRHPECYDENTWKILKSGDNPFELPNLKYTRTVAESQQINSIKKAMIISASGMCHAGRIKHHLKHNLWRPESHIVFVGYQAEGTLGRKIVDGATRVKIFNEDIAVKAKIHTLGGFSAHADQADLARWVSNFKPHPSKIFLTHGEPESMRLFTYYLQKEQNILTWMPAWKETVVLKTPLHFIK